uniref:Nucleolar GTP-binding protein 1 n=1 Tax=Lygus hesperus TaxID=30085 RepID=A0A0A9W7B3_LYGHE
MIAQNYFIDIDIDDESDVDDVPKEVNGQGATAAMRGGRASKGASMRTVSRQGLMSSRYGYNRGSSRYNGNTGGCDSSSSSRMGGRPVSSRLATASLLNYNSTSAASLSGINVS